MFDSIRAAVSAYFATLVPKKKQTIWTPRAEPLSILPFADLDRIQAILFDAQNGNVQDLFGLYRDILLADSHLQGEWNKRKLAILGDTFNVQPRNKDTADDVSSAAFARAALGDVPNWLRVLSHLLDSTLWPLSVVEKIFAVGPDGRYRIRALIPVPYQLLDYRMGYLMIRATDPETGYPTGDIFAPDPDRYIIHRGHLLSTPDNWGGPMRSLTFWAFLGSMNRDSWARFLERFGAPFLIGKYDQSDDASRAALQQAFSAATKLFGLVISTETQVELVQAASSQNGDAFAAFHKIAQAEKSKLIVGQTLSADAAATGLGSGTSDLQGEVRQDIRQLDAMMLGATLSDQLCAQLLRINGMPGNPPVLGWGSESPKAMAALGDLLSKLQQAGLSVADDALPILSARFGFQVIRAAAPAASPFDALWPLSVAGRAGFPHRADAAIDAIARGGSADLARAFGDGFAPLRRMILNSSSPEELERDLRAFSSHWPAHATARLISESLQAFAANGTLVTDH